MKKNLALALAALLCVTATACGAPKPAATPTPVPTPAPTATAAPTDSTSGATRAPTELADGQSVDAVTSASLVPDALECSYFPKGFQETENKKALFVVADPRYNSVCYDMAFTAMKHFEENGVEVELRDLYTMGFNPVLSAENFYNAKDGFGETPAAIQTEQDFVTKADYIIFVYPNWHDSPNTLIKGYMETVFAKQFAYESTDTGLAGKLTDKSIYTIMNAGYLGGGRGYIGDGVGNEDAKWDSYMNAFKVFDDDTAAFWGAENLGRFVNDRTPKNKSETYEADITALRTALTDRLDQVFLGK